MVRRPLLVSEFPGPGLEPRFDSALGGGPYRDPHKVGDSGSSSATGTPSSPPVLTRCSPRSASRPSAPRCVRLVRTRTRSGSYAPSATNVSTISSSSHDDISNRCSTSTSATTTRRDHTVACSSPSQSPTRSALPTAARSLTVTSSVASSKSTTASPDPRLRWATLTATLRLFSRALRARPATEHYRSLPGKPAPDPCRQPSPREVPQDSPRRVYGPFRD